MSITLENKQGLIAGDGSLPVKMAQYAKENGFEVICISLAKDNVKELKKYCSKVYSCHPGEVNKIESILKDEQIKQMTFLGKVHKKVLLQLHKFDKRAIDLIKEASRLNDDQVMLMIVEELSKIGVEVLDQTIFIKNLMIPAGVLGKHKPTEAQMEDVNYGFWLAKEMGKLDVGQSVVIKDKMIMAVEAIEGTDVCIKRGAKLAKEGILDKYNVPLLVDNAHGAYLKFLDESNHPMDLGAAMCCDSAHKTLPALTGGAYLHINKKADQLFKKNAKF